MIKLFIFDIGRVITNIDFLKFYVRFSEKMGIDPSVVIDYHKHNFEDLIFGKRHFGEFLSLVQEKSGKLPVEIQSLWVSTALELRFVNADLLALIDHLRDHYKVCTLTNLTESRMVIDQADKLYDHFDDNFLSCEHQLKKPDPKFFQLPLNRFAMRPDQALFIDDKPEMIAAAESLGLKGLVYEDNAKLWEDLKQLRLL